MKINEDDINTGSYLWRS